MLRLTIIIGLLLSLAFLVRGAAVSLRESSAWRPPNPAEKTPPPPLPPVKLQRFYPPVPKTLPDLRKGYIFNEARSLVKEEKLVDDSDSKGPKIKFEDITYSGSIKTATFHKALIAFPPSREDKASDANLPASAKGKAEALNYKQLVVGEVFGGYKLIAIEAEKLVFERGGNRLEKFLHDPKKERLKAPDLPKPQKKLQKGSAAAKETAAERLKSMQGKQTPPRNLSIPRPTTPPEPVETPVETPPAAPAPNPFTVTTEQ